MEFIEHHNPTRLIFGEGCLERLAEEVARTQRRCMLVTGRRAARLTGLLERVQDQLLGAQIESVLFDQVEPNPVAATIADGARFAREKAAGFILAVGGGSALDAAKAISLAATNPGRIEEYLDGRKPERPPLPLVAVPTTAGCGSEVSPDAYITHHEKADHVRLSSPLLFPRLALLDPALTATMPDAVTVSSGLDAMCHAIEAICSRRHSTWSDLFARSALDRIVRNLPRVRARGDDLAARAEVQLGATLAGLAKTDAGGVAPHALATPITMLYDLHHGRAAALLLPAFLAQVGPSMPERVGFIGRVLGQEHDAAVALRSFIEGLGVAPRLAAFGVQEKEIPAFVERVRGKSALADSPGEWTPEAVADLYRQSL